MSHRFIALAAALAAMLAFGVANLAAHEGHDHSEPAAATPAIASPRLEAASSSFELVAVREAGSLRIWLDKFDTNEPVTTAVVVVETPDGSQTATPEPDGTYKLPSKWSDTAGIYDLIFTIQTPEANDILSATLTVPKTALLPSSRLENVAGWRASNAALAGVGAAGLLLGALVSVILRRRPMVWAPALAALVLLAFGAARLFAHDGEDHGPSAQAPAASDHAQALPGGEIFLPKTSQRVLAVLTKKAEAQDHKRRLEMPGRIIPDPNGSGLVQASSAGRLSPPPDGFPHLGQRVQAGDILAYVATPFLAIDQSTMRQQQGDLDQQLSIVERRLARSEILAKSGAVATATLEDTRAELRGLRERRAALDKVKRDAEPLRAPVNGVIAAANAVAGQIADPNTTIFQIVDPSRLWVEALTFDTVSLSSSASARTPDGRNLTLAFVGAGLADRNQSAPVNYAIEGAHDGLRLGQFVTVLADTATTMTGLTASRASVVRRANGESVVYAHSGAERFEPRIVRTRELDGERVLILAGVEPGARIVTQAAELINQIR